MAELLSAANAPFTFALGLLFALLALELIATLIGVSLFGDHGDVDFDSAPGVADLHASFDLDPDATPDVDSLLTASVHLDHMVEAGTVGGSSGLVSLFGLGHTPFMIWLASVLLGFGVSGLLLQSVVEAIFSTPLPVWSASLAAAICGIAFVRSFGRTFARLIRREETTATSAQFMGGLRGVVTQGIARAGAPAEVRLRDRHGNIHYMRCEPFRDSDIIPEGTDVITLRERLGPGRWGLRIIAMSEDQK